MGATAGGAAWAGVTGVGCTIPVPRVAGAAIAGAATAGAATGGPVPAGMVVAGGGAYLAAAWATIVVFFFSTSTNCFIRSFNDIRSLFDSS